MAINSFRNAGLANTNTVELTPPPANFSNTATGTYTDSGVDYKYVTFTSSDTLTVTTAGYADILIVGGGGGAGNIWNSPGCGGGGSARFVSLYLEISTITIVVGGGGARAQGGGAKGAVSTFNYQLVQAIGGGGGAGDTGPATTGSTGGGGLTNTSAYGPASGTTGLGFAGARNGGGGVTGAAVTTTGGAGLTSSITGSAVEYGQGGSAGSGTGTANTGKGGGASGTTGSNGGSGVIIVRVRTN